MVGAMDYPLPGYSRSAFKARYVAWQAAWDGEINMKRELNQILSGNGIHHLNSLILLKKNMLCSKLHCQKVLIEHPFHIRILGGEVARSADSRGTTT